MNEQIHKKLVQDAIAVAISAPARPAIVAFAAAFSTAFAKARILKASGRPKFNLVLPPIPGTSSNIMKLNG
jgi:hypothetical protein